VETLHGLAVRMGFGLEQAIGGVFRNRLRSVLTVLGVTIGVASVVSLVALGEGARLAIVRQFESLGTNVIKIESHHWMAGLTVDDARELVERVPTLSAAMPVVRAEAKVKWRRTVQDIGVLGVSEHFPFVRDHEVAAGRFFSHLHVRERLRVAVVGAALVDTLFEGRNPIGQRLYVGNQRFTVIGVLSSKGAGLADDIDRRLVIPVTAAQRLTQSFRVSEIWAKASSKEAVEPAVVQIGRILRSRFKVIDGGVQPDVFQGYGYKMYHDPYTSEVRLKLPTGQGEAITVTSLNELVREANAANRVMTLMLGGIAGVSLLVGGLGIMNMMLVSVTERTTEIGLRKSLGATRGDLMYQFLLEAFLLSALGGVLGLGLGTAAAGVMGRYGMEAVVSPGGALAALAAALIVGLVFGGYPAHLASGLAPAEALRRQ